MKFVLAFSLILNLALAMVAGRHWQRPSRVLPETVATSPNTKVWAEPLPAASLIEPAPITNRFHWRMIESTNYEEFVRNLRAVGCPEKTVRDIMVAEVRKTYAMRRASVPLT